MADGAYNMVWDNSTSSWVKANSNLGNLSVDLSNQTAFSVDMFDHMVTAARYNQIEINFDQTDPDLVTQVTVTKTSGGDAINASGQAVFSTGANTSGGIKCVTNSTVVYRPNSEIYAEFSCVYSSGLASSYQRIGCYDANNGFFVGYEGTSFGVTLRKAGVDTRTSQSSFNIDTLTGKANSKFTRNGVPEALDPTKDNLYRIRFGWLGAAPVIWEVLSPDGKWVVFNIYRHPNTVAATSINNPNLPITLDAQKTSAGATNLTMSTACWAIGTSSDLQKVSSTLTDDTLVKPVRSVLVAKTPGGSYTNIDATAGANLKVSIEEVDAAVIVPVSGYVIVNNTGGASAVNIQDGGNSITVDGTFWQATQPVSNAGTFAVQAAQSGTWSVRTQDGAGNSLTSAARGSERALSVQIVDAAGNQITSFGGSGSGTSVTQYTEDAASAGGETGTMFLAVRNDAAATKTSNDGDFSAIAVDAAGRIGIADLGGSITVDGTFWQATQPVSLASVPSHPVTNAGTFAVQVDGSALTALQLLDDTIVTDNAGFTDGTTKVSMAGFIYDEVAGTALTENDAAAARINVNRAIVQTIEDGTTRGRYATVTSANAIKIDGSAVTQPVSIAAAVAVTDNSSSLTVDAPVGTPVFVRLSDGASAISTLPVSLASVPSHAVTNAGTFAVQVDGSALTSLQLLDDVVVADNAAFTDGTTKLSMAGFIYDEVAGTALTENDAAAARINVNRAVVNTIEDGATRGRYATVTAANALKVDGSAVTQPVSIAAAVAVTDNSSSLTVDAPVATPVFVRLSDGASAISTLPVSLASVPSHAVTNAGTFAVQVDGSALTALQLIDDPVFTDDAAFTIASSKVNMAGGYAVAHGSNPDAADAGDAGVILMNRHRIPFTMGGHPNTISAEYLSTGNITDDNILPAIAGGTKYVITGITVAASAANTTNATVRIGFGATAVPTQGATNADAVAKVVMSLPGIPPGGGAVKGNGGGIVGIGGDGEELRVTITNMATGNLTIVVDYYTIES